MDLAEEEKRIERDRHGIRLVPDGIGADRDVAAPYSPMEETTIETLTRQRETAQTAGQYVLPVGLCIFSGWTLLALSRNNTMRKRKRERRTDDAPKDKDKGSRGVRISNLLLGGVGF